MKRTVFALTAVLFGLAVMIVTIHINGGNAAAPTAIYWAVLSIRLMIDMIQQQKG